MILFYLIVILFSAIIHEYMHGWAADRLGDPTAKDAGRLTINPIPHIDVFGSIILPALMYLASAGLGMPIIFGYAKPVPINPYNIRGKYGTALVSLAGPFANFFTALIFGLILRFGHLGDPVATLLAIIVEINLVLMIFNLVPIPPLDGSKVVLPFLPYHWQVKYLSLERVGFLLVLLFIFFGFSLIIPAITFLFRLITGYWV